MATAPRRTKEAVETRLLRPALAYCWQTADGFPDEVKAVFAGSSYRGLVQLELLLTIPEHKTPLPGGRRTSQPDRLVLAKSAGKLLIIEASAGKETRLAFMCETLGLVLDQVSAIRYG